MSSLDLVALIVHDYDEAIRFFVDTLDFVVEQDEPSYTTDGRIKRWVVVRPPGGGAGLLLARADGERQQAMVGGQWAGRVGLFLRVDDVHTTVARLEQVGVVIEGAPRTESYGVVVVFRDPFGNRWDLIGKPPAA